MVDILAIGSGAVNAYRQALATTSNNIANVNTPGYSRRELKIGESFPVEEGVFSFGSGAQAEAVARIGIAGPGAVLRTSESDISMASAAAAVAVRSTTALGAAPSDSVSILGRVARSVALKMSGSSPSAHRLSLGVVDPTSAHVIWLPNESGTILTSASDYNVAAVSVQGFDSVNGVIEIAGTRVARAPRT